MINQYIIEFKQIFNKIRNLGYVKAVNNYNSGIGLTFEHLLGKEVDNFPFPDFKNSIEIKTKLAFSTKPIHLFKLTPDGNEFIESKRLLNRYGYFFRNDTRFKAFNGNVYANKITKIGYKHYFSLKIDYKEEKILLVVYNDEKLIIDCSTYWTFEKLENALLRKLKYLALVQVWPTEKNGDNYYKYYRYDLYRYSNFYTFLNLIEKGIISISFSIDIYTDEKRYGKIHDHGTNFDIQKDKLEELFIKMY